MRIDHSRSSTLARISILIAIAFGSFGNTSSFALQPAEMEAFDHSAWANVLNAHVNDKGFVDYAALMNDDQLSAYLRALREARPERFENDDDRLAFWINAYNALTIQAVLETLPKDREKWSEYRIDKQKLNGRSILESREFEVAGEERSLISILNNILRKKVGLRDPRMYVVLNRAAKGGPPLWNQAFVGSKVRDQLSKAMARFVEDESMTNFDKDAKTIKTNRVIEWHVGDFTDSRFFPHGKSLSIFFAEYVSDDDLKSELRRGVWKTEYFEFDWRLNVQK